MKRADCRNELVMRSRRQTLSSAEEVLLDAHLVMCETCRFDREVGADFDEVSGLHPGYEMREERIAAAVLKKVRPRTGWAAARPSLWLRSAIVFGVVGATVVAWASVRSRLGASAASTATAPAAIVSACTERASCGEGQGLPTAVPEVLVLAAPAWGELGESALPETVRVAGRRGGVRHGSHATSAALEADVSAAELFERATEERQRKHAAQAIEIYAELQRRYPVSKEALVSRVSLGRLFLEHGMPADANTQFDAYLTAAPGGALAPEALFGKARALEALGRRDEARDVWRRVATSLPGSPYAAEAKRRLDAQP
ncbi:MAG TPA: tetratricopeptide repeat protein [Polyangiaceae bacterium]|jgi:TolA-binding protein